MLEFMDVCHYFLLKSAGVIIAPCSRALDGTTRIGPKVVPNLGPRHDCHPLDSIQRLRYGIKWLHPELRNQMKGPTESECPELVRMVHKV